MPNPPFNNTINEPEPAEAASYPGERNQYPGCGQCRSKNDCGDLYPERTNLPGNMPGQTCSFQIAAFEVSENDAEYHRQTEHYCGTVKSINDMDGEAVILRKLKRERERSWPGDLIFSVRICFGHVQRYSLAIDGDTEDVGPLA